MINKGILSSTLFCAMAITVSGCADRSFGYGDDLDLRGGDFWEDGSNHDANQDVEVREGDGATVGDILCDIDGGVTRDSGNGGLVVEDDTIRDYDLAAGTSLGVRCTGVEVDKGVYQLVNSDGSVALTYSKRQVYAGDVGAADMTNDNVAFSLHNDHIYLGHWSDGVIVATASANLNQVNAMRGMLFGGLVTGECGGSGLP